MKTSSSLRAFAATLLLISCAAIGGAGEPVTLDNVVDLGPNDSDEPLASEFSIDRAPGAARFRRRSNFRFVVANYSLRLSQAMASGHLAVGFLDVSQHTVIHG